MNAVSKSVVPVFLFNSSTVPVARSLPFFIIPMRSESASASLTARSSYTWDKYTPNYTNIQGMLYIFGTKKERCPPPLSFSSVFSLLFPMFSPQKHYMFTFNILSYSKSVINIFC